MMELDVTPQMYPPATSNVDHKLLQGKTDYGARHRVHRRCPAECGPRVEWAKAKTLVVLELEGLFSRLQDMGQSPQQAVQCLHLNLATIQDPYSAVLV